MESKLLRASSEKICLQETVLLLSQCINKENHGWSDTDKSLTLKLCQKKRQIKNSSYDFGENEVLFVKNGARVLDLWLDTSFGTMLF